ncbi:hypothetical protein HNY73_003749 [Argiope bruennichi]|uniref:PiggyBac transposable element-derived protein domain-containing protein n=1 Tax=Argiope bruennichi TaxID=94029 RepID=A0A8T0FTR2_ARGBR|nr:hypothetical protein HNY73_003749 [Argiope bruennichi]
MANCRSVTIPTLMETSDSEDVSEEENNASENSESSDSDYNMVTQPATNLQYIGSKDKKIKWRFNPPRCVGRLNYANVIKTTPGVTRYSTSRITNVKNSFETVFSSTIQKEIIKLTNIDGKNVHRKEWKILDNITFEAYIGLLLLVGVYKSQGSLASNSKSE